MSESNCPECVNLRQRISHWVKQYDAEREKSQRLADIMRKFNFTDDRIKDLMMHYPNLTVIGALVLVREIAEESLREYGGKP